MFCCLLFYCIYFFIVYYVLLFVFALMFSLFCGSVLFLFNLCFCFVVTHFLQHFFFFLYFSHQSYTIYLRIVYFFFKIYTISSRYIFSRTGHNIYLYRISSNGLHI